MPLAAAFTVGHFDITTMDITASSSTKPEGATPLFSLYLSRCNSRTFNLFMNQ
jgi:hypothetical protein